MGIICNNNNKNMAYPYTMYRCGQGNFGRSQVIKTNIRFDLVRKTYQGEGYGSNHPSLRALVDANQSILKREFHESFPFYKGEMSSTDAFLTLLHEPKGTYLLRGNSEGDLRFSIRSQLDQDPEESEEQSVKLVG